MKIIIANSVRNIVLKILILNFMVVKPKNNYMQVIT